MALEDLSRCFSEYRGYCLMNLRSGHPNRVREIYWQIMKRGKKWREAEQYSAEHFLWDCF